MSKLTKKKLMSCVTPGLNKLAYIAVQDSITGANGLYIKPIESGLFMSLGLTISRFYDSRFTGDFYLSPTTNWGSIWGDIPKECYQRVGAFLSDDERFHFLEGPYSQKGVSDSWWDIKDALALESFLDVVKLTEERMISNSLIEKIKSSKDNNALALLSRTTIKLHKEANLNEYEFRFLPQKNIDGIPLEWFMAAELSIKTVGHVLNINTVKLVASDSYRQMKIMSGGYKKIFCKS